MRREDKLLFLLSRQVVELVHVQQASNICSKYELDWQYIYSTSKDQGVAPLIYTNLLKLPDIETMVPREILEDFDKSSRRNILIKKGSRLVLHRALNMFNQESVDAMLIKGEALNLIIYDFPWYTFCADTDLVIRLRRDEISPNQLKQYLLFLEKTNRLSSQFKQHLEFDFYTHHDLDMNGVIPLDIDRVWQDAIKVNFEGLPVYLMTPEDTIISIAINSCRKRYFRLKSLLDLAETINKNPNLNWEIIKKKSLAYQCNNILFSALFLTQKTLGCKVPVDFLKELGVDRIRKFLIIFLIACLLRFFSLADLSNRSDFILFGRKLSLSLLLTYTTYPAKQWKSKFNQVFWLRKKSKPSSRIRLAKTI